MKVGRQVGKRLQYPEQEGKCPEIHKKLLSH